MGWDDEHELAVAVGGNGKERGGLDLLAGTNERKLGRFGFGGAGSENRPWHPFT